MVEQLNQISDQLELLLSSKRGVSPLSFWVGLGLTFVGFVATIFLTFGRLQSDVQNHITLFSEKELEKITLSYSHSQKDWTQKKDFNRLEKRVDKLEK